ncbi:MAG: tetratricopeptide repeat protein [Candidatus Sumerlaeaceae bacterium]|nr:tetratricopeptide repeat protein [Candidatus Sumerlaeaceae bacterium]
MNKMKSLPRDYTAYLLGLYFISWVTAFAQTTDPVTLLRQVPRVQFPGNTASAPNESQKPRSNTLLPSQPEALPPEPQRSSAPLGEEAANEPAGHAQAQPPAQQERPAETSARGRSLLSRIPFVGRLVAETRLSPSPKEPEPTPTPPILLPPPQDTDSVQAPVAGTVAPSVEPPNFYSQPPSQNEPPAGSVSAAGASSTRVPNPEKVLLPTSQRSAPISEQALSPKEGSRLTNQKHAPLKSDSIAEHGTPSPVSNFLLSPTARSQAIDSPTSSIRVIYPRLTPADFVVPTAEIEPSEAARNEYLLALTAAREGRTAEAAAAFRAFAQRYATSRLAPRALFMAALLDTDPQALAEDVALLRKFFPRSDYLTELELRGVISAAAAPTRLSHGESLPPPTAPMPDSRATAAQLREEIQRDYRDRNYAAAIAKLENSPLTPQDPALLEALAQCQVAIGDNVTAVATIEKILTNFPTYDRRKNVRLTYGLLLEDAGKYERAIAEYRKLIEEAPDSVEAQTARTRIQQLDQLTR